MEYQKPEILVGLDVLSITYEEIKNRKHIQFEAKRKKIVNKQTRLEKEWNKYMGSNSGKDTLS